MQRYVIERELPGAGKLTAEELKGISARSNGVLADLGPDIRWLHSYVTGDKIYCVYEASGPDIIREHAASGGFPADRIEQVSTVIDPSTGR